MFNPNDWRNEQNDENQNQINQQADNQNIDLRFATRNRHSVSVHDEALFSQAQDLANDQHVPENEHMRGSLRDLHRIAHHQMLANRQESGLQHLLQQQQSLFSAVPLQEGQSAENLATSTQRTPNRVLRLASQQDVLTLPPQEMTQIKNLHVAYPLDTQTVQKLAHIPNLQTLSVHSITELNAPIANALSRMQELVNLKTLVITDLTDVFCGGYQSEATRQAHNNFLFKALISKAPNIEEVKFSAEDVSVTDENIQVITQVPCLQKLTLQDVFLTSDQVINMARKNTIKELDISLNLECLTPDSVARLAAMPCLEQLNITSCSLTREHLHNLCLSPSLRSVTIGDGENAYDFADSFTRLTVQDIVELEEEFPNVRIVHSLDRATEA